MKTLLKNVTLIGSDADSLTVVDGVITALGGACFDADRVFDLGNATLLPGAVDVHAHLREPGYEYKSTILSATESAAKGGITRIMAMPNLKPVPDSTDNLAVEEDLIKKYAKVFVYPFAALTEGEKGERLSDIEALAKRVKAFSDDGVCVNDLKLLEEGMRRVKAVGGIIASHAERKGACDPEEAEYRAVAEELELAAKTGVRYHFCHMSLKKSFRLIAEAKRQGMDITCEVTPHHLTLDLSMIKDANWKMNPPLRKRSDVEASIEALRDGTADMIATDHAPHAKSEKSADYYAAPNGILGFETMFPAVYTALVKTGIMDIETLSEKTTANPAKRFGLDHGRIDVGERAEFIALDTDEKRVYTEKEICGEAANSPYIGAGMYGYNVFTQIGDKILYKFDEKVKEA